MLTELQLEAQFRQKLRALLAEYDAELSAEDHYQGYAECGEDIRMTVSIPAIYKDGDQVRPWVDINLEKYFSGK